MYAMTKTVLSYEPPAQRDTSDPRRYALLALLCAAATIAYVQRSAIAVPAGFIQNDLRMDKVQFGWVMSIWLVGYAIAQIPSGWLGDRWGSRKSLTFIALLWSAATALVALARGYQSLLWIWFFMGVAQAGIFPCSARAIKRSFPDSQRASATGMLGGFMGLGAAVAPVLTGLFLAIVNWRGVFVLVALPGVAWAALFYSWGRHEETAKAAVRTASDVGQALPAASLSGGQCPPYMKVEPAQPNTIVFHSPERPDRNIFSADHDTPAWLAMLGSSSMWLLCAQQFLRAAAMIFFTTWFPTFLRESRPNVSVIESGFLTALAGAGAVAGSFLGGFSSDFVLRMTGNKRLSRQGIAVAGMTTCALLIVAAYFIVNTTLAVAVISLGAFCGTFGGVSGYTVAMDFGGQRVSTVFSIMNMCGNIGAAAFPLAIGWLVKRTGNWNMVLFIFAGIFAADAVCWALLNPKKPLFEEE
jgi:MFS family permease